MTTVKSRLILLSTFFMSAIFALFAMTFLSYQDLSELRSRHDESHLITSSVSLLNHNPKTADLREQLKTRAQGLKPEFRKVGLERWLERDSKRNFEYVLKSETAYRQAIEPTLAYIERRLFYFASASAIACAVLLFATLGFVFTGVFSPLHLLLSRMKDFLNNRYSYQFTVPEQHEIGQLHATFNSMAQRVLRQIEELKTLDKAKSEFLSIASHELRTPLTSIKGSLGLLKSGVVGPMNEAAQNLMNIALNETERLIRIINEFLDLAKIEAKQFPLSLKWSSVEGLLKQTCLSLEGFAQSAEVELKYSIEHELEALIDADRIQQVITNLASNAIKFSPKKGTVLIRASQADQGLLIEVVDQGRGIAPEDQELIFEKFRQATSASNPLVKGTGLGLAIAKALVEEHKGSIGVRSAPGQGSTFYFSVPEWRLAQRGAA